MFFLVKACCALPSVAHLIKLWFCYSKTLSSNEDKVLQNAMIYCYQVSIRNLCLCFYCGRERDFWLFNPFLMETRWFSICFLEFYSKYMKYGLYITLHTSFTTCSFKILINYLVKNIFINFFNLFNSIKHFHYFSLFHSTFLTLIFKSIIFYSS